MRGKAVLTASGLGATGVGGLFALAADGTVEVLDGRSTTGFAVAPGGQRLARLLWDDEDAEGGPGRLRVSDAAGRATTWAIDALREPHGLLWRADGLVAVSTFTNAILWLDPADGAIRRSWTAAADEPGDAWHLNDLVVHDGRLLASAFGRFRTNRGWAAEGARDGAGIVFDVETGADVLTGFTCPHDPTPLDGGWLVCDSGTRRLLRLDAAGGAVAAVDLGGFTRGIAHDDAHVYVGLSAHRLAGTEGCAAVVALDRRTLAEVRRWALPCQEVYGLGFVPDALAAGVRAAAASASADDAVGPLEAPPAAQEREHAGGGLLRQLARRVQAQMR